MYASSDVNTFHAALGKLIYSFISGLSRSRNDVIIAPTVPASK